MLKENEMKMKKKIKIWDISWDMDDEDAPEGAAPPELPVEVETELFIDDRCDDVEEEDTIVDWLSDEYGFLVNSFRYEVEG